MTIHPLQAVEDRNAMMNHQKPLSWLEDALGVLCETLSGYRITKPAPTGSFQSISHLA